MIFHIIVGDMASAPLKEAVALEPQMAGTVVVLKDLLHLGELVKAEGQSFSDLRSAYWNKVIPHEKTPILTNDLERVLDISTQLHNSDVATAWIWLAPSPADVSAYHWLLGYLGKHREKLRVVNIAGLPFLDENGKLYYPKNFSQILPKEIVKARRLARQLTAGELEVDSYEWQKLVEENAGVRIHEGGKKLVSKTDDYYDKAILSICSEQFQKASKVIKQTLSKMEVPTGDLWLVWRIRTLIVQGQLIAQGDSNKAMNEFEIRLPGEPLITTEESNTTA